MCSTKLLTITCGIFEAFLNLMYVYTLHQQNLKVIHTYLEKSRNILKHVNILAGPSAFTFKSCAYT